MRHTHLEKVELIAPLARVQAIQAVLDERDFQIDLFGEGEDQMISLERELLLIEYYTQKARSALLSLAYTKAEMNEKKALLDFRIIAALAVRAMENYGAPARATRQPLFGDPWTERDLETNA